MKNKEIVFLFTTLRRKAHRFSRGELSKLITSKKATKVKENLSYEILQIDNKERPDFLQSVIRIITDTVCSDNETVIIGKVHRPLWKARQQLMRLDENYINYVDECLSNSKTEIHNIKAYLLAMLYNAPDTMDAYYTTKVNRDMAVGRTPGEE